jgi:hypothetical protein
MTIKKAVEHFVFKFKNVWSPTKPDVDALNTIMNFVKNKHELQLQNNELFAKLYVMVYAQFLERYNATVFDDIPVKELNRYLDTSLERIIQRFTQKLNDSELYSLFEDIGIEDKHPALKKQQEKNKETELLKNAIKDKNNLDKLTGSVWDYETVKENLELQINNTLNLFPLL